MDLDCCGIVVGDAVTFPGVRRRSWWRKLLGLRAAPSAPLQTFVVTAVTSSLITFDRPAP
jgi:hypothetical protein